MNNTPTIQQAAQLAEVTQMAGGVKPLHKSIASINQPGGHNMQSFGSTKSSDSSSSNSSSSPAQPIE